MKSSLTKNDPITEMARLLMYTEVDTLLKSIGGPIRAAIVFQNRELAVKNQKEFFDIFGSEYLIAPYYLVRMASLIKDEVPRLTFICDGDFSTHKRNHDQFWLYDLTTPQIKKWAFGVKFPPRVISV